MFVECSPPDAPENRYKNPRGKNIYQFSSKSAFRTLNSGTGIRRLLFCRFVYSFVQLFEVLFCSCLQFCLQWFTVFLHSFYSCCYSCFTAFYSCFIVWFTIYLQLFCIFLQYFTDLYSFFTGHWIMTTKNCMDGGVLPAAYKAMSWNWFGLVVPNVLACGINLCFFNPRFKIKHLPAKETLTEGGVEFKVANQLNQCIDFLNQFRKSPDVQRV